MGILSDIFMSEHVARVEFTDIDGIKYTGKVRFQSFFADVDDLIKFSKKYIYTETGIQVKELIVLSVV